MIRNNIKIALRFFTKNKLFTVINIAGLAIGITAFLLLSQYILFERSFDQDLDDVYRVTLSSEYGSDNMGTSAANHPAVAPAMIEEIPEVRNAGRMVNVRIMGVRGVLSYKTASGQPVLSNLKDYDIYFADGSILDIFHIPLLYGDKSTVLEDTRSMVLSESLARKIFGDVNPVGKNLTINSENEITVTGVFQDLPENTHLKIDAMVSMSTLNFPLATIWNWPEFYNYVQLSPGIDPGSVEDKMPGFVQTHMDDVMNEYGFRAEMNLQPVQDIHLTSHLSKEMTANSSKGTLYFLMIVALFVIGIALINFINLSTAKSLERAKEVGIKKVVGAQRRNLIYQFICESLILNLISIILAIGLVVSLTTPFNNLAEAEVLFSATWTKPAVWLIIFSVLILGGLLAGLYPAFVLSDFRPVTVLKGKFHRTAQGALLRKGLVIVQFAISIALISGTYIVYKQFAFMQDHDLGFQADQNLVINAPIDVDSTILQKMEVFKNEITRQPNIIAATMSNFIPGSSITDVDGIRRLGEEKSEAVQSKYVDVDQDFFSTYGIKIIAGRDFRKDDISPYFPIEGNFDPRVHPVIINQSSAKALGYLKPEEALHQKIVFKYGPAERTGEVIGVVENHHQESLDMTYENIVFVGHNHHQESLDMTYENIVFKFEDRYLANYLTIHISGGNIHQAVTSIEYEYNKLFPRDPFTYFFLDEYFNRQYAADLKFGLICLLFSGLAIFIAALGLFGMGSHMALEKVKEISVRKVMGATNLQALVIIPGKLLSLVLVAGVIAIPVVYLLAYTWLEGYAFRMELNVWMFVIPLLLVLGVAMVSILSQSIKSAYVNPAVVLRNE